MGLPDDAHKRPANAENALQDPWHPLPGGVMSGHADLKTAVSAFRKGIADFLENRLDDLYLPASLERCIAAEVRARARTKKKPNT